MRIFTWPVHGNYFWYLSQCGHDFYVPVRPDGGPGYGGRGRTFPLPATVHEVPADTVRDLSFDCVLYQSSKHWEHDRHTLLSDAQRRLPTIVLEHDPPREHPCDTRHAVADRDDVLLVHVTHFNDLMWDAGKTATTVVEHGVMVPEHVRYAGDLERGIVIVNDLASRGRRLGADIFEQTRTALPIDLVGMRSELHWGVGEVPPTELAAFTARYRFYFHPIRWTSLGLALLEAMMIGLPVVGLATTELAAVITNGVDGIIDTDVARLVDAGRQLLADPDHARELGAAGQRTARERFGIERFVRDWCTVFSQVV